MTVRKKGGGAGEVRWAPRIPKSLVRRLYESDARNLIDTELIEEAGSAIWARCRSILAVSDARAGLIMCPRCRDRGRENIVEWNPALGDRSPIRCPSCRWQTSWGDYRNTFRKKQLHEGAAGKAFRDFLSGWDKARTASAKMLAIDRVIHEFHVYLFRKRTTGEEKLKPSRAVCVNLIEGRLSDVVEFLENLAYGNSVNPALREQHDNWHRQIGESQGIDSSWDLVGKRGG